MSESAPSEQWAGTWTEHLSPGMGARNPDGVSLCEKELQEHDGACLALDLEFACSSMGVCSVSSSSASEIRPGWLQEVIPEAVYIGCVTGRASGGLEGMVVAAEVLAPGEEEEEEMHQV